MLALDLPGIVKRRCGTPRVESRNCRTAIVRTVELVALQKGGWPRRRAYLIDPARHAHMIGQFQDLARRTVTTAAFVDEREALDWSYQR